MTIVINPKYEKLREKLVHIDQLFEKSPYELFCSQNKNSIRLIKIGEEQFCVKHYGKSSLYRNIAVRLFKSSKGKEAYLNAALLRERGFQSQEPVAYVAYHKQFVYQNIFFICAHNDYQHTLHDYKLYKEEEYTKILKDFALFVSMFHKRGFYYEGSLFDNILFECKNQHYEFSILDTNGLHLVNEVTIEKAAKNISKWNIPSKFLTIFLKEYAINRNISLQDITEKVELHTKQKAND